MWQGAACQRASRGPHVPRCPRLAVELRELHLRLRVVALGLSVVDVGPNLAFGIGFQGVDVVVIPAAVVAMSNPVYGVCGGF